MTGLLITPLLFKKHFSLHKLNSIGGRYRPLLIALSGYAIVVAVTLIVQLVPAVKQALSPLVVRVDFPEVRSTLGYVTPAGTGRQINLFAHTGSLLFYASVLAYLVYRAFGQYQPGSIQRILGGTLSRVLPSSVSIVSMISLALVMEHCGMTDTLARGLAGAFGTAFPLVASWIGAIGAFMTGSNTNSNVMFGLLQLKTAQLLGSPQAVILAAQTAGAALASAAAPAKVVVGSSTAGMAGREGEVMRQLVLYIGIALLAVSLMAIIAATIM
jgi:lactate permease